MFKCNECIFYDKEGYRDMGCHIPECKLIMINELRKKNKKLEYDLFKSLIQDELKAEQCPYFKYVSEIVDLVMEDKNNG